jgi:hypothetical protein
MSSLVAPPLCLPFFIHFHLHRLISLKYALMARKASVLKGSPSIAAFKAAGLFK